MNFKSQKNQKNHYKIPLYPPFSKGEANISSLWKREAGRDFQSAKVLPSINFVAMKRFVPPPREIAPEICTFLTICFNLVFAREIS